MLLTSTVIHVPDKYDPNMNGTSKIKICKYTKEKCQLTQCVIENKMFKLNGSGL